MRRENNLLRTSSPTGTSSTVSRTTISIKNVAELLGEYAGLGEEFSRWRALVNLLCTTYELDSHATKILVGSKLKGKTFEWYHSRVKYLSMDLDGLLKEMEIMFDQPLGKLEARRQFERRRWQKEETFADYCHNKIILGNRVPISDDEIVDYINDGIPYEDLQNQARINSFSSVQELLNAFKKVKISSVRSMKMAKRSTALNKSNRTSENLTSRQFSKPRDITDKPKSTTGVFRCYHCNGIGHYSRDCKANEGNQEAAAAKKILSKEK